MMMQPPHLSSHLHLVSVESLQVVMYSFQSFLCAVRSPYVLDKLRRYIRPVLAASVGVWLLARVLLVPMRAVASVVRPASPDGITLQASTLSFGFLDSHNTNALFRDWVSDAVALVPLLVMLTLRTVIRRPLYKTLVHALRDVNPQAAAMLEAAPKLRSSTKQNTTGRALRSGSNVGYLVSVDLLLFVWRSLPFVGRFAAPVSHYVSMSHIMGPRRAAALSLLGLWAPAEFWVFQFVRLWRTSRVLGEELLEEWVARTVPPGERRDWLAANDLTITLFVAPQALLMQLPFVGPLAYVPMQAAAAWLLDLLLKKPPALDTPTVPTQGVPRYVAWGAPTKPPELQQQLLQTMQPAQQYQYPALQQASAPSFQQPSAPPYPG